MVLISVVLFLSFGSECSMVEQFMSAIYFSSCMVCEAKEEKKSTRFWPLRIVLVNLSIIAVSCITFVRSHNSRIKFKDGPR